jgi:DNA invertase Pin-like site-specific DNA recombinase
MADSITYGKGGFECTVSEKIYKTAIYARLSSEDIDSHINAGVSGGTIENQILLVQKYIESKPYLRLYDTFADNGQTGTNFERAGFQKLMESAKRGKIDCIAVKDLSRFGRDYIETGDYIEKILPFLGVRFISVNDGYDSHDTAKNGDILTVALKNLINDIYAKDISRKVRTAFETKQQKGEYIGGQAPYGYLKSPENKHKLIINDETAPVVRDIFQWKLDGMSDITIMRRLNALRVPSPSNYLYSKGLVRHEKYSKKIMWGRDYIGIMLTNPVYIGHMAQGKTKCDLSLGIKNKIQSKGDWIIVENTHEPIIEASVFDAVGKIITQNAAERASKQHYGVIDRSNNSEDTSKENIFVGLVYCSECGKRISRRRTVNQRGISYVHFSCPTYDLHLAENCKNKIISEKKLRETISETIKLHISLLSDMDSEVKKVNASPKTKYQEQELHTESRSIEQRIYRLKSLRSSLYDDFTDNILPEDEYMYARQKYEAESNALTSRLEKISAELDKYSADFAAGSKNAAETRHLSTLAETIDTDELTREILTAFVERITIYSNERIEVKFKYQDEFARVQKYVEENNITI